MILSNEEIRRSLGAGEISIDPAPADDQYTTSAVDLYLGGEFRCWPEKLFSAPGAHIELNLAEQKFSQTAAAYLEKAQLESPPSMLASTGTSL